MQDESHHKTKFKRLMESEMSVKLKTLVLPYKSPKGETFVYKQRCLGRSF